MHYNFSMHIINLFLQAIIYWLIQSFQSFRTTKHCSNKFLIIFNVQKHFALLIIVCVVPISTTHIFLIPFLIQSRVMMHLFASLKHISFKDQASHDFTSNFLHMVFNFGDSICQTSIIIQFYPMILINISKYLSFITYGINFMAVSTIFIMPNFIS